MKEGTHRIGDHVVYGSSGVCLVEEIRTCRLSQDMPLEEYYILKPIHSSTSTVYVPIANRTLCAKMRPILSRMEIDCLLESASREKFAWIEDRKERTATFREMLAGGDRRQLILLVDCILRRIEETGRGRRKVSTTDHDILQAAERAIREEFSFSLGIPPEQVSDYILQRLGRIEST